MPFIIVVRTYVTQPLIVNTLSAVSSMYTQYFCSDWLFIQSALDKWSVLALFDNYALITSGGVRKVIDLEKLGFNSIKILLTPSFCGRFFLSFSEMSFVEK